MASSYAAFVQSMLDAPALDEAIELVPRDAFRITSVHEFVPVFGLAGYTPAPGWNTFPRPDGHPYALFQDGEFEMRQFLAVNSLDGAVEAAKLYHLSKNPSIVTTQRSTPSPTSTDTSAAMSRGPAR